MNVFTQILLLVLVIVLVYLEEQTPTTTQTIVTNIIVPSANKSTTNSTNNGDINDGGLSDEQLLNNLQALVLKKTPVSEWVNSGIAKCRNEITGCTGPANLPFMNIGNWKKCANDNNIEFKTSEINQLRYFNSAMGRCDINKVLPNNKEIPIWQDTDPTNREIIVNKKVFDTQRTIRVFCYAPENTSIKMLIVFKTQNGLCYVDDFKTYKRIPKTSLFPLSEFKFTVDTNANYVHMVGFYDF